MICKSKDGNKYIAGIYNKCFGEDISYLKCYFQSIETLRQWIDIKSNFLENRQGEQRVKHQIKNYFIRSILNNM